MKKRRIIIGIVILLAVLIVCTLPFPTRIDMKLQGVELYPNGTLRSEGEFSIQGWKLNYLLRQDTVQVKNLDFWYAGLPDLWYLEATGVEPLSDGWEWAQWRAYLKTIGDFGDTTMFMNLQEQSCVIKLENRTVIVSASEDFDYGELLAQVKALDSWVAKLWE